MKRIRIACACTLVLLASVACSSKSDRPADASAPAPMPAPATTPAPTAVAVVREEVPKCTDKQRPRCEGPGNGKRVAPRAYRFVGGSGDPIDQVVCDIAGKFVLDGKLFGTELSGGQDGTYKLVRMPNIPGLHWSTGGRYHIEFPDGDDKPGTMTTEGGGTTTAVVASATTSGAEHFTLTPMAACE